MAHETLSLGVNCYLCVENLDTFNIDDLIDQSTLPHDRLRFPDDIDSPRHFGSCAWNGDPRGACDQVHSRVPTCLLPKPRKVSVDMPALTDAPVIQRVQRVLSKHPSREGLVQPSEKFRRAYVRYSFTR